MNEDFVFLIIYLSVCYCYWLNSLERHKNFRPTMRNISSNIQAKWRYGRAGPDRAGSRDNKVAGRQTKRTKRIFTFYLYHCYYYCYYYINEIAKKRKKYFESMLLPFYTLIVIILSIFLLSNMSCTLVNTWRERERETRQDWPVGRPAGQTESEIER